LTEGANHSIKEIETDELRADPGPACGRLFVASVKLNLAWAGGRDGISRGHASENPRILDLCLFFNRHVWFCGSAKSRFGAGLGLARITEMRARAMGRMLKDKLSMKMQAARNRYLAEARACYFSC
jgi:hypothetical protein